MKKYAKLELICLMQDLEDERGNVIAAFPEAFPGLEKYSFGILQVLIRNSTEKKSLLKHRGKLVCIH